jgi:hypothetical protein
VNNIPTYNYNMNPWEAYTYSGGDGSSSSEESDSSTSGMSFEEESPVPVQVEKRYSVSAKFDKDYPESTQLSDEDEAQGPFLLSAPGPSVPQDLLKTAAGRRYYPYSEKYSTLQYGLQTMTETIDLTRERSVAKNMPEAGVPKIVAEGLLNLPTEIRPVQVSHDFTRYFGAKKPREVTVPEAPKPLKAPKVRIPKIMAAGLLNALPTDVQL